MKIVTYHSHQNGWEFIKVHKPGLWKEIEHVVAEIDATKCRTKKSREKRTKGKMLYSPIAMNKAMDTAFARCGWKKQITRYWVTEDAALIDKTLKLPAAEQKRLIEANGRRAILSYNQTDFVKDRVAIEVQFGKYSFVAYDLFVKHMAFYIGNVIDVGVEILAMKELQSEMASGVGYYESELYNLVREGRGVPAVPLVLIGVSP
ncbi:MAG: restriction endonuclease [Alphaproteobacteria bacterium]|nr:restriction endonuclease [Alphaproteobacteria bacterium]MDE2492411.1 restriction endonuclease [Alphaproteobacteria bacterium]